MKSHSQTAVFSAFLRGYYSKYFPHPMIHDELSLEIIPKEIHDQILSRLLSGNSSSLDSQSFLQDALPNFPGFSQTILRTYLSEKYLLEEHYEQYVILGAGLDTSPLRYSACPISFFEVDHPQTLSFKKSLISHQNQSDIKTSYISTGIEGALEALQKNQQFNPNKKTLFTLQGLSMYLSKQTFIDFLLELDQSPITPYGIFFDFFSDDIFETPHKNTTISTLFQLIEGSGEKLKSGYRKEEIQTLFDKISNSSLTIIESSDIHQLLSKNKDSQLYPDDHVLYSYIKKIM